MTGSQWGGILTGSQCELYLREVGVHIVGGVILTVSQHTHSGGVCVLLMEVGVDVVGGGGVVLTGSRRRRSGGGGCCTYGKSA